MEALISAGISLLFLGFFFWGIHSLSVLRLQLEDVIARLERIEHGRKDDHARSEQAT